jgi:LytS/YehU family sensor histidine kinase
LRVKDDGHGAIEKTGNGIGLSNTRARLENLYGAEQNFEINSPANGGFTVEVRIPFREQPAK